MENLFTTKTTPTKYTEQTNNQIINKQKQTNFPDTNIFCYEHLCEINTR